MIGAKLRTAIQTVLAQARAAKPSVALIRVIQSLEQALRDSMKVE